jgi:phosphoglycerate dehydrogenase-like enzyme
MRDMGLCVLEYIRDPAGVWSLPADQRDRLRVEFPAVSFLSPATRDEANERLPEADVVYGWAVNADNLAKASRLRWIHVSAAGVGPLLFPALVASDVVLTNGSGLHSESMGEHAIGVMLAFVRNLHLSRDAQLQKRWVQSELLQNGPPFRDLAGSTIVIVGFGRIGTAIARRAHALGLHVIAVRKHPAATLEPAHEQWGIERLGEALARADWVVLATPLTPVTKHLIGAAELKRMRPEGVILNLGRGALIDEPALIVALREKRIAGAGLDVTAEEPLPEASPLWAMPNVILTPHTSGLGPRHWERAVDQFAGNLRRYLAGEPLENVVDKQAGY